MRSSIIRLRDKRATHGQHPGLLLQRYLCENATGEGGNPEEKRDILQAAINAASNSDVREIYKIAFERWWKSMPQQTVWKVLQTAGRLIVGLGSENVLETGIRLHHTYGMPILPGSALKGLAAHYCAQVWGESDGKFKNDGDFHQLLFDTTDESGCIVYHDAWFVPESENAPLKLDVMTPHHPNWIDGSEPPTDFDSPTPVPFLSVAGQFHVAVSWIGPDHGEGGKWTTLASDLLNQALREWGVGGKTTSGYGRLVVPPPPPPPEPYKGKSGETIIAVLLAERTKKGGWRAQVKGFSQAGPIQNTEAVPESSKPGDSVKLTLASVNDREVAFKWPPSAK